MEKQTCPTCRGQKIKRAFKGEVEYCDTCHGTGQVPEASDYGHHIDKGPGATHFKGDDCEASAAKEPTDDELEVIAKAMDVIGDAELAEKARDLIAKRPTPVASEAKPFKRPPSKEEQAEIDKYYPATPDKPKLISNDPQLIKNEPKVISTPAQPIETDSELFRLASLIGCEPQDEARHREQLATYVAQREAVARKDELEALDCAAMRVLHKDGFRDCIDAGIVRRRLKVLKGEKQ